MARTTRRRHVGPRSLSARQNERDLRPDVAGARLGIIYRKHERRISGLLIH